MLYAESVDYTTNHSWWLMDQLVWDGIFAKTPHKPNLIQETGIMYVETPDGRANRTEAELRNILERKYAYSFSTGGAGAVQWLWNTNFYMNNINESNIGALRADGTEKPEADVSYGFGRFMKRIRDLFRERALEDVAVVFPYSNDLSNRRLAVEATSRLTRVLAYELNVHFRAVSEYALDALVDHPPKLVIVPSPHNFSGEALDTLVRHVSEHGGSLLLTGPVGLNEYWQPVRRLDAELGPRTIENVLREEAVQFGGRLLPLSYGERKIAQLCKEVAVRGGNLSATGTDAGGIPSSAGGIDDAASATSRGSGSRAATPALEETAIGRGRLLWCGLPVELSDRAESVRDFYAHVLARCGVESELRWERGGELSGVYGRKLAFRDGSLFVFVSEYACDADIRVTDPGTGTAYEFELESERTVMFAADREGRITATYRDDHVRIRSERS